MSSYQKRSHFISFICFVGLLASGSLGAQPYTPKKGSAERTAILDAVRFPLQAAINQEVIFVVDHMKVEGTWAFLKATPKTKAGGQISYKGTKYAEEAEEADEMTVALLEKRGGQWVAVSHTYFTTDVWWEGLWNDYPGCPRSIFP